MNAPLSPRRWVLLGLVAALALSVQATPKDAALVFQIDEGRNLNHFVREGPVAAHLLLRSGTEPRILVAFPAGNSGVGLWFATTIEPVTWTLVTAPKPITALDARRRALHGIEFEVEINAPELNPREAVLSSVRVLRDYELQRTAPAEVMVAPRVRQGSISWARDRLDGAAGFSLTISSDGAKLSAGRFAAMPEKGLRLKIRALSGEPPMQPLETLLTPGAGVDIRARQALAFLSYREKFLAGSWRFNTYFGRDTLISAMLLAPVLEPSAIESAMASVLDRLAPNGEVAHEEDIGEFAVLRNAREGRGRVATPIYDYGMVDDDFLLAPLAVRWLEAHGARAPAFLSAAGPGGISRGRALVRNLTWLVERTASFADDPRATNLIAIKPGRTTGNWRDSEQGLGRGRYAYDVNAALVPASLEAAARLAESGVLDSYLDPDQKMVLSKARAAARIWTARAPGFFAVDIPAFRAREEIRTYAKDIGVDAERALRAATGGLGFHALSLDEQGKPVPILHSDEGFRLLFTEPSAEDLHRCLDTILRPFPVGLMTDVGLVVANPALASAELEREFSKSAYHGTVVWSWQHALLAAGLERQLRRVDLPAATRAMLLKARVTLWAAIDRSQALRTSELWSWGYGEGRYHIEPFGRRGADADESNAAQLWSTVFLGLTPPDAGRRQSAD